MPAIRPASPEIPRTETGIMSTDAVIVAQILTTIVRILP
jgi:hypothetical protein